MYKIYHGFSSESESFALEPVKKPSQPDCGPVKKLICKSAPESVHFVFRIGFKLVQVWIGERVQVDSY